MSLQQQYQARKMLILQIHPHSTISNLWSDLDPSMNHPWLVNRPHPTGAFSRGKQAFKGVVAFEALLGIGESEEVRQQQGLQLEPPLLLPMPLSHIQVLAPPRSPDLLLQVRSGIEISINFSEAFQMTIT
jgi:hypothetical protein